MILSGVQDAGVRSPAPRGADVCRPAAAPPWGRSTEAAAAMSPGEDPPLWSSSHPEGSPRPTVLGWSQQVQVKGERALAGPRGLAGSLRAAGNNAASPRVRLGTFLSARHSHWPVCPLPPAGRSLLPPGTPPPPGKLHDGLDPGAVVGGEPGCKGQDASPVPSPPRGPARSPGAAFGLKSVYGHTWKEPNRRSPSGEIAGHSVPWRGPPRRGRPSRVAPSPPPPSTELNSN